MKIIKLTASNIKRLVAVEITPDGNVVEITGKNMMGKSSVLDSIWYALGGKKAQPDVPIRRGQKTAEVYLDLGDIRVTRKWTDKGSYLSVTNAEGLKFGNPQKVLDDLVGNLSFDPTAFVRMKPADQVVTLKQVAGLDFTEIDNARQLAYDQRRDLNRDAKVLEAKIGPETDAPAEYVSIAKLGEQLTQAGDHNRENCNLRDDFVNHQDYIARTRDLVTIAKRELTDLEKDLRDHIRVLPTMEDVYTTLEDINLVEIQQQITDAEAVNIQVRDKMERADRIGQLDEIKKSSDRCTADINRCDTEKQNQLENATLPVDGLNFDDTGVTFNGLPFEQSSGAEQLRVSVAMGLALNPKLKVMLIRDGSLLDDQSYALLAEMADDNDAQIWLETVSNGEGGGVVIEDGSVVVAQTD